MYRFGFFAMLIILAASLLSGCATMRKTASTWPKHYEKMRTITMIPPFVYLRHLGVPDTEGTVLIAKEATKTLQEKIYQEQKDRLGRYYKLDVVHRLPEDDVLVGNRYILHQELSELFRDVEAADDITTVTPGISLFSHVLTDFGGEYYLLTFVYGYKRTDGNLAAAVSTSIAGSVISALLGAYVSHPVTDSGYTMKVAIIKCPELDVLYYKKTITTDMESGLNPDVIRTHTKKVLEDLMRNRKYVSEK